MQVKVIAKQIGGSIGIIIPREVVEKERISSNDVLKLELQKEDNLDFLWEKNRNVKKPTEKIMEEIDEGEND